MRAFLISLFVVFVIAVAGVWLGGGWLLERATRSQLPRIESFASRGRISISDTEFTSASLVVWPPGAEWRGLSASTRILASGKRPARVLPASAKSVTVSVNSWSPLTADVRLEGLELGAGLDPDLAGEELPFNAVDSGVEVDRVTDGFAELPGMPVNTDPVGTFAELAESLRELFTTGATARDLNLGARVHLRVRGLELAGRLATERTGGRSVLRLNRDDVDAMAERYERPLTGAEKTVLAEFPLRAVSLLRIKEYAERLAAALAQNNPASYGEDFSRHVIWSYWLARVFGESFAERVTDAHEEGDTGNTAAESSQDFANNAVGRRYAVTGLSESEVLKTLRTDPSIVRTAR
ncbi:MAG TPA: hypothetical protein VMM36_19540 [Opitutaceae bacterium]|nr:hypothetical protein [Opitutaceae bacterium]